MGPMGYPIGRLHAYFDESLSPQIIYDLNDVLNG